VLTDTLPNGLSYLSATGTGWTCAATGATVTCNHPAALAADASSDLVLTVKVLPAAFDPASRQIQNTATVTGGGSAPAGATDTAPVSGSSVLTIGKKLVSYADDTATYRITVSNRGPNATAGLITVTDRLPTGLRLRSVHASDASWQCDGTVICQRSAALPVGVSSVITIVATVTAPAGSTITNTATVTGGSGTPGPATTSSAVLAVSASGSGGSGGLAQTGRDTRHPLNLAVGLLLAGLGLLLLGRRRRRS